MMQLRRFLIMKSIRILLLCMIAVLLMAIPAASLAFSMADVEDRYTYNMEGIYYEWGACYQTDFYTTVLAIDDLKEIFYNEAFGSTEDYTFTWEPSEVVVEDGIRYIDYSQGVPDEYWGYQSVAYWFEYEDVSALKGKTLFTCVIRDGNGNVVTNVDFVMSGMISSPSFESSENRIYFTPGDTVTFSLPDPVFNGNGRIPKITYQLTTGDNWEGVTPISTSRTHSLTLTAEHDGMLLRWGYKMDDEDGITAAGVSYKLYNLQNNPIIMPNHQSEMEWITLEKGQSYTISLPAATGNGGKVVYHWYCHGWTADDEYYFKDLGYTNTPSKTITYADAIDSAIYACEAGYEGDDLSKFLPYDLETMISRVMNTIVKVTPASASTAFSAEEAAKLGAATYGELIEEKMNPMFMMYAEEELTGTTIIPMMITLQTEDGKDITSEYFEEYSSLKVKIPMPNGYSWDTHNFCAVHVFSQPSPFGYYEAGDAELCFCYDEGDGQLTFYVSGLSPVAIYAIENGGQPEEPPAVTGDAPRTGDSTPIALLAVLMMLSLAGCIVMSRKHA